jgi:hypothetical protein
MFVKTEAAITTLERASRWLKRLTRVQEDDEHEAVNLVTGCFWILRQSPTTDVRAWLARRPHRKALQQPARAIATERGRRAIRELILLTRSEVQACQAFRPHVDVGPLPMAEPAQCSPERYRQLAAARRRRAEIQQERQAAVARRLAATESRCQVSTLLCATNAKVT